MRAHLQRHWLIVLHQGPWGPVWCQILPGQAQVGQHRSEEPEERQMPGNKPWWLAEEQRLAKRQKKWRKAWVVQQWKRSVFVSSVVTRAVGSAVFLCHWIWPGGGGGGEIIGSPQHICKEEQRQKEEKAFRFQAYEAEWMSVLYWDGTFLILLQKKQSSHKYNSCLL